MLLCMLATLIAVSGFLHPPLGRLLFYKLLSYFLLWLARMCTGRASDMALMTPVNLLIFLSFQRADTDIYFILNCSIRRGHVFVNNRLPVTWSLKPYTSKHSWMNRAAEERRRRRRSDQLSARCSVKQPDSPRHGASSGFIPPGPVTGYM